MRTVIQPPKPGPLLESMRAIGYSLETSLADLIDNSIAAGASAVDILFQDRRIGEPYLAILDDGSGMTEPILIESMRHGSSDPRSERAKSDLGRFGLGMKTASQSQCRALTVITKHRDAKNLVAAQWDIDHVHETESWELQVLSESDIRNPQSEIPAEVLAWFHKTTTGTAVLWRRLDRLIEPLLDDKEALATRVNQTRDYLGLVFHRYIDGTARRLSIRLNGKLIDAHDPFLLRDAPPWKVGEDRLTVPIGGGREATINYEAYVLPALTRLTPRQIEGLTASGGLRRGQGFYVYRENRLLVWGNWFRLVKQHELSKLARIKIDVPNSLDHLWALDIRKSTAMPPEAVRGALRQAVERVQFKATRAIRHRGHSRTEAESLWRLVQVDNVTFRIEANADHQIIEDARARLGDLGSQVIDDLLEALAAALPYGQIYAAMAGDQRPGKSDGIPDAIIRLAQDSIERLTNARLSRAQAIQHLMQIEPFSGYPELSSRVQESDNS